MARVELAGVTKRFAGGVIAVASIDLVVDEGELVVLVGPSGSGKSTVLRLIAGLEQPTVGRIRIGDREVTTVSPRARHVAYVPQSCPLYPHLNVYDNLAFGRRLRNGVSVTRWWHRLARPFAVPRSRSAEESAAIDQAARRLGIGHMLERWPRQLSGGERQRVALGKALVRDPAVFLFDEPLSSLDANLRTQLRTELKQLHRQTGRATLYVTHDQAEATALADRLVVLAEGRIQQSDTPDGVYDHPANRFVGQFIGSPTMNLLPGRIGRDNDTWCFLGDDWRLPLPTDQIAALSRCSGPVELGLRAEAIELLDRSAADGLDSRVVSVVRQNDVRELTLATIAADERGRLITKVLANTSHTEQMLVRWRPRWSLAHWFDGQTGQRIEFA